MLGLVWKNSACYGWQCLQHDCLLPSTPTWSSNEAFSNPTPS